MTRCFFRFLTRSNISAAIHRTTIDGSRGSVHLTTVVRQPFFYLVHRVPDTTIDVYRQFRSRLTAGNLESRVYSRDAVWYSKYLVIYACVSYVSFFRSVVEVKKKKRKEKGERLVDHELLSEAADGATWFTRDEDF